MGIYQYLSFEWASPISQPLTSSPTHDLLSLASARGSGGDSALGQILVLRICRPQALNALNLLVLEELHRALQELALLQPPAAVLIFTGEGSKAFVAGADVTAMAGMSREQASYFSQLGHQVMRLLESYPGVVIAAVQGFALGGGLELALACDCILASESAVFGAPEVGLGIIPGFGGTVRLSRWVGVARAKEWLFSGRKLKALEAHACGLVNKLFADQNFLPAVIEWARPISENSSHAVVAVKKLMHEEHADGKLDAEIQQFSQLFGSWAQKEGMSAFLEKRKPHFKSD